MKKVLLTTIALTAIGVAVRAKKTERIASGTIEARNFRMINSSHGNLA